MQFLCRCERLEWAKSRCRRRRGGPRTSAHMSAVPVQMRHGCVQSRCRCGRGASSPGADVAPVSAPGRRVRRRRRRVQRRRVRVRHRAEPGEVLHADCDSRPAEDSDARSCAAAAVASGPGPGADVRGVGPVPAQMWEGWARSRGRCGCRPAPGSRRRCPPDRTGTRQNCTEGVLHITRARAAARISTSTRAHIRTAARPVATRSVARLQRGALRCNGWRSVRSCSASRRWQRHICTGTGLTPCRICAGTGLTPATSAPGLGSRRCWALQRRLGAGEDIQCNSDGRRQRGQVKWFEPAGGTRTHARARSRVLTYTATPHGICTARMTVRRMR